MAVVRKAIYILSVCLVVFAGGCKKIFLGGEPDNTYSETFEVLWNDFDRYYSYFTFKDIDWDSLYIEYKPRVEQATSRTELFDIFSELLDHLQDSHISLYAPFAEYDYNGWENEPANFDLPLLFQNYLSDVDLPKPHKVYLTATIGDSVGYVWIQSFGWDEDKYFELDDILQDFESKDMKGLIIDIRDNGGGSDINSDYVAARFLDQKVLYRIYRYRNGPGHDDFTPFIEDYLSPAGRYYSKSVVVLTNRQVNSAAEDFVLAMRQAPNATFVGDSTEGGAGNPILRELPNGWEFRLSRWQVVVPETMEHYEGIGLAPDIKVDITETDLENGRDPILEKALEILNE